MSLHKYRLGELIELLEHTNSDLHYGVDDVRGVNNLKRLMPTKADVNERDLSKFQIVKPGEFVFNHRTSRNGSKFSIALNDGNTPVICTEDYVVFRIKVDSRDALIAEWLYLYFNRSEFDRYVITNSWGSSTEFYNWEDLCDIDIELPDLPTQQKYVDVYNAMVANQQAYERGLEDLKLVCDVMLDKLKKENVAKKLGDILINIDVRNKDMLTTTVVGINIDKELFPTVADLENTDLKKYKILCKNQFAYSPMQTGRDESIRVALCTKDNTVLVSPAYFVLQLVDDKILPEYVMMWFLRTEFDRYGCFLSDGSVRASLDINRFFEIELPVPSISIQKSIADIFKVYNTRKRINEQLKAQIKDICPILIKGSIDEARR